jgi:hypothetical protein
MDFGDLIILLILLAPLLKRLFGKEQKPPARPQGTLLDDHPALVSRPEQDPLAEALRQIREAMAESEPAASATSAPPKPLPARPKPLPPKPKREPEFRALGAFEHDEHGFGLSNPISEELFERGRKPTPAPATKRITQKALGKVDLTTPIEVTKGGAASGQSFARMLTDDARLREAFVMKEILDPPRSMHRGR